MDITTNLVLILVLVWVVVFLIVFALQYGKHAYWHSRAWGTDDHEFNAAAFTNDLFALYVHLRDYGVWRILSGSTVTSFKKRIANPMDDNVMFQYLDIVNEIIRKKYEQYFMKLHSTGHWSYKHLRTAVLYLADTSWNVSEDLNVHISDCFDYPATEKQIAEAYHFIRSLGEFTSSASVPLTQMKDEILLEVSKAIPYSERERFDRLISDEGVVSLIISFSLRNERFKKTFGTCSEDLPFDRDSWRSL